MGNLKGRQVRVRTFNREAEVKPRGPGVKADWGRIKKMDAFAIVLKTEVLDGKVTKAVIYERI